jgi:hypothetical protein
MKSYFVALIAGGLILSSTLVGIVHGRLTNRWGVQPDMKEAARRLENTPLEVEGWQLVSEAELGQTVVEMLQCKGSLNRVYKSVKTGDYVSFVVLLGPPGPIAVHTPEICYSSRDYRIEKDRSAWLANDTDQLWDLGLKAKNEREAPLRVLYGWTSDGEWKATDDPRFAFAGQPMLYKIQLAGPPAKGEGQDACKDFLTAFLPLLRKHVGDGK